MGAFLLFDILIVMIGITIFCFINYKFNHETYHKITGNSYLATICNNSSDGIGRKGEYLIYKYLKNYEKNNGKFLFNCYIPKEGDEITEIDVLLICESGIFVFESKNYSGWIWGNEKEKFWTQSLAQGKGKKSLKKRFLNPIMQNKLHIKWLRNIVGENIPLHSIIVFSERCTLKKIEVTSANVKVVKRDYIAETVKAVSKEQRSKLSAAQITSLYKKLYPYTQVSNLRKQQHIANIQKVK